jgi:hypothetical protein
MVSWRGCTSWSEGAGANEELPAHLFKVCLIARSPAHIYIDLRPAILYTVVIAEADVEDVGVAFEDGTGPGRKRPF